MVPPAPRECNQLAAPVSAHATATSSLRLYLRMQLQPVRRAQPARAHRPPRPPCITITHLAPAALHALRSTLRWFRLVRNRPFSSASEYQTASSTATSLNLISNPAIQHKLSRYVDTSMSLVQNGIYGTGNTLMTVNNLANEFRPYYETKSNYMIWYDFAVIQKKVKVHKHRVLYLVMFFRGLKVDSCVFLIWDVGSKPVRV